MKNIEEKNIRCTTVPLKIELIKEFYLNKEIVFLINYKKSELKGSLFLTYITNLDLPCELSFEGCSYQEKAELLKIYMTSRVLVKLNSLKINAAHINLNFRGINTKEMFINPMFNELEVKNFQKEHREVLIKWEMFLESTNLFAQTLVEELNKKFDYKNQVPNIEDQQFIGVNVVHLFSVPNFLQYFFLIPYKYELKYFRAQFEEPMFMGKNLYHFYNCHENELFKLFIANVYGGVTFNLMSEASKEADAIIESAK